jgi:hypothetical protein
MCHPNHPNCVTGVTCTNCDDGFNPHLIVACNLVYFSDGPITLGVDDKPNEVSANFGLYPNPSDGIINISTAKPEQYQGAELEILTPSGKLIRKMAWNGETQSVDLSSQPKGIYFIRIRSQQGVGMKKFILM